MPKALRTLTLVILPALTLLLGMQIGMSVGQKRIDLLTRDLDAIYGGGMGSGATVTDPEKEVDMTLFWSVWKLLARHYIDEGKLQAAPMLFGATNGLVRSLGDPYTAFMTPTENKDFTDALQGHLQGIGAELTVREERIVVVAPLKGSPAEAAGLFPEDIILRVGGEDIAGESLNAVVQRIRGRKGTSVTLTIFRPGTDEEFDKTIVREDIRVPSVESGMKETADGPVGIVTINQFGDTTTREVEEAIKEFDRTKLRGLILDVRFNGGGYLEGAIDLTSMFIRSGQVVSVVRRNGEPVIHYVNQRPINTEIPLAVLVNEGSASASEILAGALQDAGRATVIGKKTFGKGTVQEIFELPNGASVRITIARWLTPGGRDLGKEGVTPDIAVDRTREQIIAKEDPQLDAAVEWLLHGKRPEGNGG